VEQSDLDWFPECYWTRSSPLKLGECSGGSGESKDESTSCLLERIDGEKDEPAKDLDIYVVRGIISPDGLSNRCSTIFWFKSQLAAWPTTMKPALEASCTAVYKAHRLRRSPDNQLAGSQAKAAKSSSAPAKRGS
jgi:hypothetical protein